MYMVESQSIHIKCYIAIDIYVLPLQCIPKSEKLFPTSDIYLNFSTFHCICECPTSDSGQNTSDMSDVF